MSIKVVKRSSKFDYDESKISHAITAAWNQIEYPDFEEIKTLTDEITDLVYTEAVDDEIDVKQIENFVMSVLYREVPEVAREYSRYKMNKERIHRNPTELEKVLYSNDEISQENGNKDTTLTHIKNAYLAEIPSKEAMMAALPEDCKEAHERNVVYFHDAAYSFRDMENCRLLNLDELLQNGCEINGTWVEKPKSFRTACTVATQILTHVTSNSYGGCTINLLHLAKFVDVSRQKIRKEVEEEINEFLNNTSDYNINQYEKMKERLIERKLNKEIQDGIQAFTYQNQTLCSSVGQAVFLTVSAYLNEDPKYTNDLILVYEELIRQRIKGIKSKEGFYENPNFPKILYFLDEDTMKGGKYYNTTRLSAECSAKRLVPDYMSVKKHMELKGVCTPSMGCRALLSPYRDKNGELVTWGRANLGVQSLNLPYIAMENNSEKSEEVLFKNIDHYLDIAYRDMLWRINHVAKIKAKACPLLWVYGGVAKLDPEDSLEKIVYGGYYTCTLGYSGLYEAVKYITGKNHWEDGEGKELGTKILNYLNRKNKEFGDKVDVSIALYATPAEVLTDKFAKACIRDFGHVGDNTQRHFLTNGYHIPVFEEINAFDKLTKESTFSDLTLGGSISYVEVPELTNNIEAMLEIIEHIGNTSLYAEVNSELATCYVCGTQGHRFKKKLNDKGILQWECPKCGNDDFNKMRVSYRVCGYLSSLQPNQGRSEDVYNRVTHLDLEN